MTITAKLTNRTRHTVYVMGYPLKSGTTKEFPFVVEKISIVSDIGYVILDERGSWDSNSKLRLLTKVGHNTYDIISK